MVLIETFKIKLLNEAFNLAGMVIAGQLTKPNYEATEKLLTEHYSEARDIARIEEKQKTKEKRYGEVPQDVQFQVYPEVDLTPKKISGGTACLPCSRDHFTTASAVLKEAVRFAKRPEHGIRSDEVMTRIGVALEELNAMERMDLSPDKTRGLVGREKELANWGLNTSAELRHKITAIRSADDLENVAAEASKIKVEFMKNVWDLATTDGTIEKLCKGLKDEEKTRCVNTVNSVLKEKKAPATG